MRHPQESQSSTPLPECIRVSTTTPDSVTGWKRWRYRLEAIGVQTLANLAPVFPRRFLRQIGAGAGWLAYYAVPSVRQIARANLDMVYGTTVPACEKARIARASCQNFVATLLTFFWSKRLNRQTLTDIAEIDPAGLQLVRDLQAQQRPIIFITLHFGDWELLGLASGLLDIPMTIPTRTMRNTAVEAVFARMRALTGHRMIPRRHAAGKMLKALQRRECIALLVDQHVPVTLGGIWCKFFGVPALTSPVVAQFALHSGAAIVGSVAYPLPDGRLRITYGPEIVAPRTGDKATDIQNLTQLCLDFCEHVIREQPEHWLWSYKRWKHRPQAELGVFPQYSRHLKSAGGPPPAT